eukprot:Em0016g948a
MDQQPSLNFSIANILRQTKPVFKGSVISLPFCAPTEPSGLVTPTEGLLATTYPLFNFSAHAAHLRSYSGAGRLCPFSVVCGSDVSYDTKEKSCSSGREKVFKRKKRTSFTIAQIRELENKFNQQKYLTRIDRHLLARSLGLTEKHVKTWYQNRRTKWKRSCSEEDWSKQREDAATAMYSQHVQLKKSSSSNRGRAL